MTTLPNAVVDVTGHFFEEVDRRVGGTMTGLFLHGSLCWGEFFAGSDIDFVGLWDKVPAGEQLKALKAAHEATQRRFPTPVFDGFHCTSQDLATSPVQIERRPTFYEGAFDAGGTIDINLVTWHELAERAVTVRGELPPVYTNLSELVDFTRGNLDTFWRNAIKLVDDAGVEKMGEYDESVAWVSLGAARLHHLLYRKTLTSKSGAGRYIVEALDPRWSTIGPEALRIRETPESPTLYEDQGQRGRDAYDLLVWLVNDGTRSYA